MAKSEYVDEMGGSQRCVPQRVALVDLEKSHGLFKDLLPITNYKEINWDSCYQQTDCSR